MQIDFTEGRLALKLDPSGGLLNTFVQLNNPVLERFSPEERKKLVHIPVPAATRIPPIAQMWTTRFCCRRYSA